MEYFNFVEFEDKVFIPISKPAKSQKLKSTFVDHTRPSMIPISNSLEKYINLQHASKIENKK